MPDRRLGAIPAARDWLRQVELPLAAIILVGEWTGLARAIVGSPVLAAVLDVLLVALLVHTWTVRVPIRPSVLDGFVALYVVLAVAELMNPNVPNAIVGLEGFRKTAFTVVAYAVARLGAPSITRLGAAVSIGSCIAFAFAIRQFFLPLPIDREIIASSGVSITTFNQHGQLRAFSPTAGPFHLGMLAATCVVIGLVLFATRRRTWAVPMAIAAVALVLTITRAAWVATVAAVIVSTLALADARGAVRSAVSVVFVVGAALVVAGLTVALLAPATAATWTGYIASALDPLSAYNIQLRFEYWRGFLDAIARQPILGYGTSAAADGFKTVYEAGGRDYFQPHSIYFKAILELGVAGLVVLVGILMLSVRAALRLRAVEPAGVAVVIGAVTVVAVAGLTGPMLDAYPFNLLFWALLGALAASVDRVLNRPAIDGRPSQENVVHA